MPALARRAVLLLVILAGCRNASAPEDLHAQIFRKIRQGDLPAAGRDLAAIRSGWRHDENNPWYWRFRLLDAELAVAMGKYSEAGQFIRLPVPRIEDQPELEARRQLQFAYVNILTRKSEVAAAQLDAASAIAPARNEVLKLEIDVARGVLASRTRHPEEAETLLTRTYQDAARLKHAYYQAAILNNLGFMRLDRARYDEAIPYLQRALDAATEAKADLMATSILGNLAICNYRLGDVEKALGMRQKAAGLQRKVNALAKLQVSLGELGTMQVEPEKAIPYLLEALDIAKTVRDPAFASLWAANLSEVYASTQNWEAAEQANNQIRSFGVAKPGSRFERLSKLNDAAIAGGRGRQDEAVALYRQVIQLSGESPGSQWQAHAGLADIYTRQGRADEANLHFQQALDVITRTRSALLRKEYKITFLDSLIRFYRRYVDVLIERGEPEKALRVADSSRALLLSEKVDLERKDTDLSAVAQASGAVLLSYWLAPGKSYAWLVTPQGIRAFHLPGEEEITRLVQAHAKVIADLRDPLEIAHPATSKLSEILLGQIRQFIPPGSRVILVPDRALHRINFETLVVDGHYWLDDVTLAVAPSLGILDRSPRQNRPNKRSMLLIGDPAYGSEDIPKLSYAAQEVQSIGAAMAGNPISTHLREQARPSSYAAASPDQYAFIHFTAHAIANASSPLDSAILLAPDKPEAFKLYARDVLDHPLQAELVTISACRSAGARSYSGEGLVGLAWAFLQAGARNVIGGLWDVNDSSTAELMETLYSGLQAGQGPADALHRAKLAQLHAAPEAAGRKAYRAPYYWAPFQVYIQALPWQSASGRATLLSQR